MSGIEGNKDAAVKAVETNLQTAKDKPDAIKALKIAVDGKSEDLQKIWNPDMILSDTINAKEREERKDALDQAIDSVVKTNDTIKDWNNNNPDNQITKETIYAWIFADRLDTAIKALPDKIDDFAKFKEDKIQVTALQNALSMLGFLKGEFKGAYDQNTTAAVQKFQENQKTKNKNGEIDTETIVALKAFVNKANPKPEAKPTEGGTPIRVEFVELKLETKDLEEIAKILNQTEPKPDPEFTTEDLKNLTVYADKDEDIQVKFKGADTKKVEAAFNKGIEKTDTPLFKYLQTTKDWKDALARSKAKNLRDSDNSVEKAGDALSFDQIKTTLDSLKPDTKGMNGQHDPGDTGPVHNLQNILYSISKLYQINCTPATKRHPDGIDGAYGPKTREAVKALQAKIKDTLTKDKVGDKDWENFVKETGIDQAKFADGNFGPKTQKALQKFLELNPTKAAEAKKANPPAPTPKPASQPAATESHDNSDKTTDIDRIQNNLKNLREGAEKNPELKDKQKFIYVDHPEILTWIAASEFGNGARAVNLMEDKNGGDLKIRLKIMYNNGHDNVYIPPTSPTEEDRITTRNIITGNNDSFKLTAIKRALLQGSSKDQYTKVDKAQRELLTPDTLDKNIKDRLDFADKVPDILPIAENTDAAAIADTLQRIAQEALGLKITPSQKNPNVQKVATYLAMLNESTQKMDRDIAALTAVDPDATKGSFEGIPLLPADKTAILTAFLKDNENLIVNIEIQQKQLKTQLLALRQQGEDSDLPKDTKVDEKTNSINLPKTYKITSSTGDTIFKQRIDFNDCTKTVVSGIKVEEVDDNPVITVTTLKSADLAEKGNPSVKTISYTLEEVETEADESMAISNAPEGAGEYNINGRYQFHVANPETPDKEQPGGPPVYNSQNDQDELITIEELKTDGNPSGSYLTVAMTMDSKDMEFENGQWDESSIRALYLKAENLQQLQKAGVNIDQKRPVYKYTEEHNDSKVGYFIFDNETNQIITVSATGKMEVFKRSDEKVGGAQLGQVMLLIGDDQAALEKASRNLPAQLTAKLDRANLNEIPQIKLRSTKSDNPNPKDIAEKTLHPFIENALGVKIQVPATGYTEETNLGKFAKQLLDRSKDHTDVRLSDSYKQTLIASFMQDNKDALMNVDKAQNNLDLDLNHLESAQQGNEKGAQIKIDRQKFSISADTNTTITDLSGKPVPGGEIDLSDNSKGTFEGLSYLYKPNGDFVLNIKRGENNETYLVSKTPTTGQTPEVKLEKYNEEAAKKAITEYLKNEYGIAATITDRTPARPNITGKEQILSLNFNGITTELGLHMYGNPTGETKISIYLPNATPNLKPTINLTKPSDLLQSSIVRRVLKQAGPDPKAAAERGENKLPDTLEKQVDTAVRKMDNLLKLRTDRGAEIKPEEITKDLITKIVKALEIESHHFENSENNTKLTAVIEPMLKGHETDDQILLTPDTKTALIRAFLKDHGSRIMGIGNDKE